MTLSAANKSRISRTNRAHVAAEFPRLQGNWSNKRWLCKGNRYGRNALAQLESDKKAGRVKTQYQLSEYIAASTITHCLDGWSFLGRAAAADLQGDPNVARHLGYYAELRAAMSLLATEGIGVFNNVHAVLNGRSRCECFGASYTHDFTWEAFDYWASTPDAASLLFGIIKPGGLRISEWLKHFGVGSSFLAREWLTQWGLDLKRLKDDRESRNIVSYRPTAFSSSGATSVNEAIEAIAGFWRACEPSGSSRFAPMDRHLVRSALVLAFKTSIRRTPKQAPKMFEAQIDRMLHHISPGEMAEKQWKEFLTSRDNGDIPQLLMDANSTDNVFHVRHSKQVMARAALLLRTATGSVQALIQSATNVRRADLEFWWGRLGEDRGLWHDGSTVVDFVDLWTDIREAILDLEKWTLSPPSGDVSYNKLWQECSKAAITVGTTERVGLWGLGL